MNSSIFRKTQRQMFLLAFGGHICAPQSDTNVESPYMQAYGFINLGKTFLRIPRVLNIPQTYFLAILFV